MKTVPKGLIQRFQVNEEFSDNKSSTVNGQYERKLLSNSTLLIEEPNNRIYKFDGRLELSENSGKNAA